MAPITSKHHKYSSLANDETETSSFIHDSEKTGIQYDLEKNDLRSKLRKLLPCLIHFLFILAYAAVYIHSQRSAEIREGFFCESAFSKKLQALIILFQLQLTRRLNMRRFNSTIFLPATWTHSKDHRPPNRMLLGRIFLMVNDFNCRNILFILTRTSWPWTDLDWQRNGRKATCKYYKTDQRRWPWRRKLCWRSRNVSSTSLPCSLHLWCS